MRTSTDKEQTNQLVGFHGKVQHLLSRHSIHGAPSFSSLDEQPYSMTERILHKRLKKKNYGILKTQLYIIVTVTLGSISAGYVIGSVFPNIRENFNVNKGSYDTHYAQYASIVALGMAIGNIFVTILSFHKGPRKILLFAAPVNFFAWLCIPVMETYSYELATMFICAFISINYISIGAMLLADVIHESLYYISFLVFRSGYGLGILMAYIFGLSLELDYYAAGFGALLVCVLYLALFYLPESPVFVYKTNPQLAEKTIVYFRGSTEIQLIMRKMANDFQYRSLSVAKYMFLNKTIYKPLLIIAGVTLLQGVYAYYLFLMYNISMWSASSRSKRVDIVGQFEDGIILGFAYFLIPLCANAFHLRLTFGLRIPMLVSAFLVPIALGLNALYFFLLHQEYEFTSHNSWLRFTVSVFHILCYNIGHSGSIEVMLADYLPDQVQMWANVSIISLRYMLVSVMLHLTFKLEAVFKADLIILFYTILSLAGIPFVYYFVVESKGRTLQQVQLDIGGNPIGTRSSFRNRHNKYLQRQQAPTFQY